MPTLPPGGQSIPPASPVPLAKRPFLFGAGIRNTQGPQGPQGPVGPQGPPGAQGASGIVVPIDVAAGTTYTVASNTQVLYKQPITVEGSILIQGTGMLIAVA